LNMIEENHDVFIFLKIVKEMMYMFSFGAFLLFKLVRHLISLNIFYIYKLDFSINVSNPSTYQSNKNELFTTKSNHLGWCDNKDADLSNYANICGTLNSGHINIKLCWK
jgi:hypothetical protein